MSAIDFAPLDMFMAEADIYCIFSILACVTSFPPGYLTINLCGCSVRVDKARLARAGAVNQSGFARIWITDRHKVVPEHRLSPVILRNRELARLQKLRLLPRHLAELLYICVRSALSSSSGRNLILLRQTGFRRRGAGAGVEQWIFPAVSESSSTGGERCRLPEACRRGT